MLFVGVSKCPRCGDFPPERTITEDLDKVRAVALLECTACGNTRLNLADFWPEIQMLPFSLSESMVRSILGRRN